MIPFKYPDMDIICKWFDAAEPLTPDQCLTDLLDRNDLLTGDLIDQVKELYGGTYHAT